MNPSVWKRAKEIFDEARGIEPDARQAFLDNACSANAELRAEIEKLLGSYDSGFLEETALRAAEALVTPTLTPGQVVGRYSISEIIGTGGMGQVFRADDTELDRPVAFKVLHSDVAEDTERVRRFIQEARAASALNHPNILTIHEIGSFEGSRFIVSEFVDGDTLREHIRKGLTVAQSVDITCQIAAALDAAHSAGIVHRDIKPENVMLRRDGLVKVLDFGLAKLTDVDDRPIDPNAPVVGGVHTSPGVVMGTVAYMSPEQAGGKAVDSRTDLWSLGVVFHEMLAGRSPFDGETVTEIISSILNSDKTLLDSDAVPQELLPICSRALSRTIESRYQSAHDLLNDLQGEKKRMEYAIQPTPYTSLPSANELKTELIRRPTLSAEHILAEINRHKYATAGTLAAVVFFAVSIGVYKYNGATEPGSNESSLAAITLSTKESDLKMSRLATSGRVYDIAISSDGKYVAYVGGEGERTERKYPIRLRTVDNSAAEVELVAAPESGKLFDLSFSPDGKYLYYARLTPGAGTEIDRVPLAGGASGKIVSDADGGGSVSPDGKFLAFSRDLSPGENAEELLVADSDGTDERVILHTPWVEGFTAQEVTWIECPSRPAWSPEGRKIACGKRYKRGVDEYYKLIAVNVSDGTQEELSDKKWWDILGAVWLTDGNLVIVSKESSIDQTLPFQLWLVSRGSPPKQITNGLIGYYGLTASSKGDVLATVQSGTNRDLWVLPQNDASRARQITSSGELMGGLEWMPDGRILFASAVSGNVDLWTMSPDGSGRKQLTSGTNANRWPVSTPDGRYIVFMSNRFGSRFDDHVFRMDVDGKNVKQLTNEFREWSPKVSADGKWVYYIQVRDQQPSTICKISIDGGQPTVLATVPDGPGLTAIIDVGRDGRIVYEKNRVVQDRRQRTLYVIPANGGKPTNIIQLPLNTDPNPMNTYFRWTPDGKSFAFNDSRTGGANVWTIPANGKGKEKPLTSFAAGSFALRFTWSPDGKQFLVTRANRTDDGILISNKNLKP